MMATTHALCGMGIGAVALAVAPEFGSAAMLAGYLGGVLPDLDAYAAHRRSLHFPVYGPLLALAAVGVALAWPSSLSVGLAAGLSGAGAHALMDVAGGGLALRPWLERPDRAVFSHFHGRWLPPWRIVRYDGAPEDLLLALLLGGGLAFGPGRFPTLVAATLAVSVVYTLLRGRLVDALARGLGAVPPALSALVPRRLDELRDED